MKLIGISICVALLWSAGCVFGAASPSLAVAQGSGAQKVTRKERRRARRKVGPSHEVARGGKDIGKGVGRGSESMAKGAAGSAGNLVTGHPVMAGASLGRGAAGLGKDTAVGTAKGTGKISKGVGGAFRKLGRKIFK